MTDEAVANIPSDPRTAFVYFVSSCASGLYRELIEEGKSDAQARNTIVHYFLNFAAGEACRLARREGREPDVTKWRKATDATFERASERTKASQNKQGKP